MDQGKTQLIKVLTTVATMVVMYAGYSLLKKALFEGITDAQRKAVAKVFKRIGRSLPSDLTNHEETVALQVVDPDVINVSYSDIGGQNKLIKEVRMVTTLPIQQPNLFRASKLLGPSKGVLFYGPPGTGKTMLARAIAKESGFAFLNLDFSQVLDKYVGESEKLIAAVFSLATKLAPSIIFIDEIDCYFRRRSSGDHEFTSQMKAQFMSLWDGFQKRENVIVIAASNRPDTIDPAILRRLPSKFLIGLPSAEQREQILEIVLREERVSSDVDLKRIAEMTEGFSGDELKEVCKGAAMKGWCVVGDDDLPGAQVVPSDVGIEMADFEAVVDTFLPSSRSTGVDFNHNF